MEGFDEITIEVLSIVPSESVSLVARSMFTARPSSTVPASGFAVGGNVGTPGFRVIVNPLFPMSPISTEVLVFGNWYSSPVVHFEPGPFVPALSLGLTTT